MTTAGHIEQIETIRWARQPNVLWVAITTDQGLTGLGETYYLPTAVEEVIHQVAAPLLLGRPAENLEEHWTNLFAFANFFGFAGSEMRAFSALDIALWDILGQATGRPLYVLLGGRSRDQIPIYNTCVNAGKYKDLERFLNEPAELAQELLAEGIRAMKFWPWDQFAPQIRSSIPTGPAGWLSMGPVGHYLPTKQLKEGLKIVEAIRKAVGDEMEILIEGHSRWDVNNAIRICRALEEYQPVWAEDMIQPDSWADLRRLVTETKIPQAVSERLLSRFPYREVLEAGAAHIVMIDVVWTGGLTEARKIAALAEAYHLSVSPHDCTGPITLLTNIHLATALPNTMILETVRGFYDGGWYEVALDAPLPIQHGYAEAPEQPGLGRRLSREFTARDDVTRRVSRL